MRRRVPLLAALGLALGCASSPSGSPDARFADLAAAVDATRATVGIACGAATCPATTSFCCTADAGRTGTCMSTGTPNCADTAFYCDGPEDCPPAMPECCIAGGNATCASVGSCAGLASGRLLCHDDAACGGMKCCPAPSSPYELCITGSCP